MRHPEEIIGLFPDTWMCKYEYKRYYNIKGDAGQPGKRLKKRRRNISSEFFHQEVAFYFQICHLSSKLCHQLAVHQMVMETKDRD